MILGLLYLEAAMMLHEQLDRIATLRLADWAMFRLLKPVMEGAMYMVVSRFGPHIFDL